MLESMVSFVVLFFLAIDLHRLAYTRQNDTGLVMLYHYYYVNE